MPMLARAAPTLSRRFDLVSRRAVASGIRNPDQEILGDSQRELPLRTRPVHRADRDRADWTRRLSGPHHRPEAPPSGQDCRVVQASSGVTSPAATPECVSSPLQPPAERLLERPSEIISSAKIEDVVGRDAVQAGGRHINDPRSGLGGQDVCAEDRVIPDQTAPHRDRDPPALNLGVKR